MAVWGRGACRHREMASPFATFARDPGEMLNDPYGHGDGRATHTKPL